LNLLALGYYFQISNPEEGNNFGRTDPMNTTPLKLFHGAAAVYNLLQPSRAELALKSIKEQQPMKPERKLKVGFELGGSSKYPKLALRYDF